MLTSCGVGADTYSSLELSLVNGATGGFDMLLQLIFLVFACCKLNGEMFLCSLKQQHGCALCLLF